jgi:hypothetical protein
MFRAGELANRSRGDSISITKDADLIGPPPPQRGHQFSPSLDFRQFLLQQYTFHNTHTKATRFPVPVPIPAIFFLSAIRSHLRSVFPDHR